MSRLLSYIQAFWTSTESVVGIFSTSSIDHYLIFDVQTPFTSQQTIPGSFEASTRAARDTQPSQVKEAAAHTTMAEHSKSSETSTGQTAGVLQRDKDLWFEDGDLTLVARDVEFRVYKGPLMVQSPVFRDMLSLPQPSPSKYGRSSGARVHLSDSREDLRHFLRLFVGAVPSLDPPFAELSAYVRLGHKYQCDALVERNIAYLKQYYLDRYVNPPQFLPIERIGAVNLMRLAGKDELVPKVLQPCCSLGGEVVHGFTREDGTPERLSADDLAWCFADFHQREQQRKLTPFFKTINV